MSETAPRATPPGWYDDGSGRNRWWDGTQWTGQYAPDVKPKLSGVSLAGFICSTVGFLASYGPTQILIVIAVGIILSGVGLSHTKSGYRGRGFAIAGMVLGCFAIGMVILAAVTRAVSA